MGRRFPNLRVGLAAAWVAAVASASASSHYDGHSWLSERVHIVVDTSGAEERQPGEGPVLLAAVARAAAEWNSALGVSILSVSHAGGPPTPPERLGNGVSSIRFSREISPGRNFGSQFGYAGSLRTPRGRFLEADIVFNPRHLWEIHDGPIAFDEQGNRIAELHRVALHEFGHLLGMTHPGTDEALTIMRSRMSDIDRLTPSDLRDARRIAGVLIFKNRPRMGRFSETPVDGRWRRIRIRGGTNPVFARKVWLRIRLPGRDGIAIVPRTRRWSREIKVPLPTVRIDLFYRVAGRSRVFRGDRKSF